MNERDTTRKSVDIRRVLSIVISVAGLGVIACFLFSFVIRRDQPAPPAPPAVPVAVVPSSVESPLQKEMAAMENRMRDVNAALTETIIRLREATSVDPNSPEYKGLEDQHKAMAEAVEKHPAIMAKKQEIEKVRQERAAVVRKNADTCDLRWAARKAGDKDKAEELTRLMLSYLNQDKALYDRERELGREMEEARGRLRVEDPELAKMDQALKANAESVRNSAAAKAEARELSSKLGALQKEKMEIAKRLSALRAQAKNGGRGNHSADGSEGKNG